MDKYKKIENLVQRANVFARDMHNITNCKYDGKSYSTHLEPVEENALRYIEYIKDDRRFIVQAAASCHDLIEDARISYNDLKDIMGIDVAEIVFKLTDCDGRNRKEKLLKTLAKISNNNEAIYVKLCDRISNANYSFNHKSSMFKKYKQELPVLQYALKNKGIYDNIWKELEELLSKSF